VSWPPRWLTEDVADTSRRAQLAIEFVEAFGVVTKDSIAGKTGERMVLRPWQRDLIRNIYAADDDGQLLRRTCLIGVPRKSGKSPLWLLIWLCLIWCLVLVVVKRIRWR